MYLLRKTCKEAGLLGESILIFCIKGSVYFLNTPFLLTNNLFYVNIRVNSYDMEVFIMFKKISAILLAIILLFSQMTALASQITPEFYSFEAVENTTVEGNLPKIDNYYIEPLGRAEAASPEDFEAPELYGRNALSVLPNGVNLVKAYDKIVSGIEKFDEKIDIYKSSEDAITLDDLHDVIYACYSDHPEQFWNNVSYYTLTGNGSSVSVKPDYLIKKNEYNKYLSAFNRAAEELFEECGITKDMSQYEISLAIHDTLAEHITYDKTQSADHIHTAYGAMVNGLAVCDGYARSYQLLLSMAGIQSFVVTGNSHNPTTYQSEPHAWNLVCIDDKYYYTDLTWDDQADNIFYTYFNVTDDAMSTDHIKDSAIFDFPICDSLDANYFTKTPGNMKAEGDTDLIIQLFALGKQRGENFARINISERSFDDFFAWLSANQYSALFEIADGLGITGAISRFAYTMGNELHLWIYNDIGAADISTHLEPPHANTLPYFISKKLFECNGKFEITDLKWKEYKNGLWQNLDGRFQYHTIYGIELTLKGKDNMFFTPETANGPGTLITVNESTDHVLKMTSIPKNEYTIIYTFDPTEDNPPCAQMTQISGSDHVEITTDTTGIYTVILADFDDNDSHRLLSMTKVPMNFIANEKADINLNELFPNADKVMLWDDAEALHPLCAALNIN